MQERTRRLGRGGMIIILVIAGLGFVTYTYLSDSWDPKWLWVPAILAAIYPAYRFECWFGCVRTRSMSVRRAIDSGRLDISSMSMQSEESRSANSRQISEIFGKMPVCHVVDKIFAKHGNDPVRVSDELELPFEPTEAMYKILVQSKLIQTSAFIVRR